MGFEKVYITKQGALLAAKTLQGKKIQFDHVEIGSGALSGNAEDKISLTKKVLECEILKVDIVNDELARLSFAFSNNNLSNAFYFREIGIFAIDPDTKVSVLYAYANAGDIAEYINNSTTEKIEKHIQVNIAVANTSNITITLDANQIYVTEKELADTITHKYKLIISDTEEILLPCFYKVGQNVLDVFLNGERLILSSNNAGTDGHYVEVGEINSISNRIDATTDWHFKEGDILELVVKGEYVNDTE